MAGVAAVIHLPGAERAVESELMRAASGALTSFALEPSRFAEQHPAEWPDYGRRSMLAIRGLLNRSMMLWVGILALMAIGGMIH